MTGAPASLSGSTAAWASSDEELLRVIRGLCDLHSRMREAIRKSRPYPVNLRCGGSDTGTIIAAIVELEWLRKHPAIATETRRTETPQSDSVADEGAGPQDIAPSRDEHIAGLDGR